MDHDSTSLGDWYARNMPPECINPECSNLLRPDKRRPGQYCVRRGWCEGCYSRWLRRGKPEGWPIAPAPLTPQYQGWSEAAVQASKRVRAEKSLARCEDAVWLLEMGASMEEATTRAHVSHAT